MYWIVALLALVQLGIGWSLDHLPDDSQSAEIALWLHVALGIGLVAMVIVVPIWRLVTRSTDYPPPRPHWLQLSLRVSESLLFVLLLLTVLTGYLSWTFIGGATPAWTHWLPSSVSLGRHAGALFNRWHEISAIVVVVPILATLGLLTWGASQGHRMPHLIPRHRRVPGPTAPTVASGAEPEAPLDEELLANGRTLGRQLRIFGAIAFWVQLCLGLIAALLLFVTTSSSYYEEHAPTLPFGFSWAEGVIWAYLSLGMLALTLVGFYSCMLLARHLKRGEMLEGGAASAKRLISAINLGSALGVTLAILGTGFSIALLISKTVSEPPGIAITDPEAIVRAVDVFVLLANFDIVVAHFFGIMICLWILSRLHHFDLG
jgi:cytochrome b561